MVIWCASLRWGTSHRADTALKGRSRSTLCDRRSRRCLIVAMDAMGCWRAQMILMAFLLLVIFVTLPAALGSASAAASSLQTRRLLRTSAIPASASKAFARDPSSKGAVSEAHTDVGFIHECVCTGNDHDRVV